MSLIQEKYQHKAQFLPTSTLFSAVFNAITPGRYDFAGTAACQNVAVLPLLPGTIYWIRRIMVGGNVPQEDYLGSIVDFPQLTVRRSNHPEAVYRYPMSISKYVESADCEAWIAADMRDENLTLSLSGSCIQLPSMIGIAVMSLNISLMIYGFNDQGFAAEFKGGIC